MDPTIALTAAITLTLSLVGHTVIYWRTWNSINVKLAKLETKVNNICNTIESLNKRSNHLSDEIANLSSRISKIEGILNGK